MPKSHLSNDDFFLRLSELFDSSRKQDHGSIFLTQKRMAYDESSFPEANSSGPVPASAPSTSLSIIIRATNGKTDLKTKSRNERINLSTIVTTDGLEGFFTRYAEVCKAGMSGLKKRDRSKGKKKLRAKKKKGGVAGEEAKKS